MYTAYDEYVLTAFRKQAFDVLLKFINPQELDVIVKRLEKEEEKTVEAAGKAVQDTLNGKLLFYTNSVDFKLVDRDDVRLFQYNHEVRC